MGNFLAARANSNRRDDRRKNDSALHSILLMDLPRQPAKSADLRSGRNVRAELHRRVRNFTTASAEGDSRNNSRHNDQPLDTLHGLLSY